MKDDDLADASERAEEVVRGRTSLPISPFEIADGCEIAVAGKELEGASGVLLYSGNTFGILYSTSVANEAFQRFSVAHELGHYYLPGHPEALGLLESGFHYSHAHFASSESYERQADHFAASLLMPRALVREAFSDGGEGIDAIRAAASECETSLRSTAIRYVDCAEEPAAVVISKGRLIEYCIMSDPLKEIPDLTWIRKGTPLPRESTTYAFNQTPARVRGLERDEAETDLRLWFGGARERPVREQVMGLGVQGESLTVLFGCEATEEDEEAREEEEALVESWTPRFRR